MFLIVLLNWFLVWFFLRQPVGIHTPSWPWTHYLRMPLNLLTLLTLTSQVLVTGPRTSGMLGQPSTNWATPPPVSGRLFHFSYHWCSWTHWRRFCWSRKFIPEERHSRELQQFVSKSCGLMHIDSWGLIGSFITVHSSERYKRTCIRISWDTHFQWDFKRQSAFKLKWNVSASTPTTMPMRMLAAQHREGRGRRTRIKGSLSYMRFCLKRILLGWFCFSRQHFLV